jgi:hypothetical protein
MLKNIIGLFLPMVAVVAYTLALIGLVYAFKALLNSIGVELPLF